MSAPERMPPRVWVENHGCGQMHDGQGEVYLRKPPTDGARLDCAEYIRADLVQELVAEAMKRALYATRDRTWSGVEALISDPAALRAIGEGRE